MHPRTRFTASAAPGADSRHSGDAPPSRGASVLPGPAVAVVALGASEFTAGFSGRWRSPLLAVGDAFIDRTPRWLKDLAIDWFGTADKIALLVGMFSVVAACSVGLGLLIRRGKHRLAFALLGGFGLLAVGASLATRTAGQSSLVPSVIAAFTGLAALAWVTATERRFHGAEAPTPTIGLGADRRTAAQALALLATGTVLGVTGRAIGSRASIDGERETLQLPTADRPASTPSPSRADTPDQASATTDATPAEDDAEQPVSEREVPDDDESLDEPPLGPELEDPAALSAAAPVIAGLTALFTPNDDFYRIDTALTVPQISVDDWRLQITGMVDTPLELTWSDLLELPFTEADITLSCVSNEIGGNLLGTARWLGTRLDDLLDLAGVDPTADQIVGRSIDGYTCGFPTAALDGRNALVAIGMNGEPLPAIHGYPARLIVPGLYGYVSATKWLTVIELTRFDEFDSYWVERDWVDDAPIKTQSRIDTPRPLVSIPAGTTPIAGVAWAQTRGIERVEVQVDEGEWRVANLVDTTNADLWTQWWLDWEATTGRHTIRVRATDSTGAVQTAERMPPFPSGATGHHEIVVLVG